MQTPLPMEVAQIETTQPREHARVGISTVFNAAVLVSALGYFVDIYDLLLFSIVRVTSLKSLGVSQEDVFSQGVRLINLQMIGMLLGGLLWGVIGDKKGRLSVLFGSIFLYSLSNIANAFVTDVHLYGLLRFLAGVGLAGELGAAITLVSEVMTKESRGYGTSVVAGVGIMGAVFAAMVGDFFTWRVAYFIGGGMGLILLVLRLSMFESGMYEASQNSMARKGDLRLLFCNLPRLVRYVRCILVGIPVWFVVGILLTFSPELSRALGVTGEITAGKAILWGYLGISIGDFISGFISQLLHSRKKVLLGSLLAMAGLTLVYIFSRGFSVPAFYGLCFALGLASGYWAVFVTTAAEHFGTNLRATVTTTTPNFVRGAVVPLTLAFQMLQGRVGILPGTLVLGALTLIVALSALWGMEETYGKDLNFFET
jgi:MFS transporter, putative metabolite:H+ symporter